MTHDTLEELERLEKEACKRGPTEGSRHLTAAQHEFYDEFRNAAPALIRLAKEALAARECFQIWDDPTTRPVAYSQAMSRYRALASAHDKEAEK